MAVNHRSKHLSVFALASILVLKKEEEEEEEMQCFRAIMKYLYVKEKEKRINSLFL